MIEKLADRWNRLTPREQRRFVLRGLVGGSVVAGLVTAFGVGSIFVYAAEHRGDYVPPVYPRIQVENDSFRLARLAKDAARITLFKEPATEEQKDVLWGDILKSLQKETPIRCSWTLAKIQEDPSSFLAQCVVSYP